MNWLICSYYTPAYAREACGLMETLDALGLPHAVEGVPDRGSWVRNCGFKPAFLRRQMALHDRPLVWLDADARVCSKPDLFDQLGGFDFACHWRHGTELLSGTLYFNATNCARALLEAWETACAARPDEWDQRCLQSVIDAVPGLRTFGLPASYTRVFDDEKMGEPVILHTQASRRLKSRA